MGGRGCNQHAQAWEWRRCAAALGPAALAYALLVPAGCEPYRVEHRKLPEFYYKAAAGGIADKVVLEDGTVLINEPKEDPNVLPAAKGEKDSKAYEIRTQREDGSVVLHAVRPEHVLTHLVTCLHDQEYQLFYDQMLSDQAKMTWDDDSEGFEEFQSFLKGNRRDLLVTLNRMLVAINTQDVLVESADGGVLRVRLRAQAARNLRYRFVYLVNERGELRLLAIK